VEDAARGSLAARGWLSRLDPDLSWAALCWPRGEARGRCGSKPGPALGAGHCGPRNILETGGPQGGAHRGARLAGQVSTVVEQQRVQRALCPRPPWRERL
ncbi:unnamed protein product, partial [Rangifer tarandus platyrhynchus]